ncbi:MAG: four helix bundle protein [Bacteroidia bacterium]|nr:four helix bundle protein [Bacteroidia bacterium]MCF8427454.1 four helix bundle protein [Bacteroidia bacterium]MCF8448124.1 four helix bundle protein [Bacteroidia bacterium]
MRDFKKYEVWRLGMELVKHVYQFSIILPKEEKFGLVSQICRAAISIPSNIAEGTSRTSDVEFKRFLEMAIGSSFELETQLILCKDVGFVSEENIATLISDINIIQRQINNLILKIKQDNKL